MAIYYVDPFKNTDGTGTFANPKGMWFSTPFTLGVGDELRIIGRTLASMLTATEYTVTIRDSAVASNGGALSARSGGADGDFLQHDIVYFPDYDVFMRLSAGTFSGGNYLSGNYNAIPIPVAGKLTGVRMRLVDRAILPTFTSNLSILYSTTSLVNGGFTVTDNWTADGLRITDGTVKTLVTTSATSAVTFRTASGNAVITESYKSVPTMVLDLNSTFFIGAKVTSGNSNIGVVDTYNTTATIAQVYANGTGNTNLAGSSGATMYGYGNNITIKNINFYTTLINQLATNSTYKFENVVCFNTQMIDAYSKYCSNTTIEFGKLHIYEIGDGSLVSMIGAQDMTITFTNYVTGYTAGGAGSLLRGNGNTNIQFSNGFILTRSNNSTPISQTNVTNALYDNTQFAQQNETYYRKPNLPTGFTVTNEFGLSIPAGSTVYPLGNGKRVATRKRVLKGFSSLPLLTLFTETNYYTNTMIVSTDGGFNPIEVLGIQNNGIVQGVANFSQVFVASQDSTTYKTISPSLKLNQQIYNSGYWISNHPTRKARAYKNTAIPCFAGTPITVSGWVRTSDTSYVSGDFSVSLVDANGDDVATEFNPTSAFINAWEQFSFTVTPTYTGELFLAFGMTGYRGGQTYWVSDMGVA